MARILRWEDPPQLRSAAEQFIDKWRDVAIELTKRPDAWAVIAELSPTEASNLASKIRSKTVEPFHNDGSGYFEARQHTLPDSSSGVRHVRVYARYVLRPQPQSG